MVGKDDANASKKIQCQWDNGDVGFDSQPTSRVYFLWGGDFNGYSTTFAPWHFESSNLFLSTFYCFIKKNIYISMVELNKIYKCQREFLNDKKKISKETIITTFKSYDEVNKYFILGPIIGFSDEKDRKGRPLQIKGCRALGGYYPANTFKKCDLISSDEKDIYKDAALSLYKLLSDYGYHMIFDHESYIKSL